MEKIEKSLQTNLSVPDQYGENIFVILGSVTSTLKQYGYRDLARELPSLINKCKSYQEAINLFEKYIVFV